jgi:riboflavin biosynthesis pyrimidine reductase
MRYWETAHALAGQSAVTRDFTAIWRAADKIVYSRTLDAVSTTMTQLKRDFDADAVRRMKADAARDITVGGPGLAGAAIRAGLVDEVHLFVVPTLVGGGTRSLPDNVRVDLHLVDERRFGDGVVHLHYRVHP